MAQPTAPEPSLNDGPILTPHDYSRLYLDPNLAITRCVPKIVGVLACQRDPYLRTLRTRVVAVRKHEASSRPKVAGPGAAEAAAEAVSGKGGKKNKKQQQQQQPNGKDTGALANGVAQSTSAADAGEELWEVEFEDTVFFPEGGGQPFDTGSIYSDTRSVGADGSQGSNAYGTKRNPDLRVVDVFRRGLTAVHVVRRAEAPAEGNDSADDAPVNVGQEVLLEVDWERRVDHMTLHTAQHLISAICDTTLSLPTLSWYLPPHPSTEPAYAELPRPLTIAEAREVEERANELVTLGWGGKPLDEDVRVWIESRVQKKGSTSASAAMSGAVTPSGAAANATETTDAAPGRQEQDGLGLRLDDAGGELDKQLSAVQLSNGRDGEDDEDEREWGDRESRGLPKDYAGGVIRTAVIDGIDRSLCCGTHHPCLSRVGLIHVLPPSGNLTTLKPTRLFLLAGSRAYRSLLSASRDLSSLASLLACTREDALERVGQREAQRSAMGKGVTAMRAELGKLVGRSLEWTSGSGGSSNGARSLDDTASSSTTTNSTSTVRVASLSRSDESTHDFEFLNLVQTSAVARLIELDGRDPTRRGETPDGPYVLALTSSLPGGGGAGAAGGDAALTLVHITSQPADLATRVADRLKTAMQALDPAAAGTGNDRIKGGGARGRWMGKVSGKWGKREKLAWEEVLAGVARGGEL